MSLWGLAMLGGGILAARAAWAMRHRGVARHVRALGGEVVGDRQFVTRRGVTVELRTVTDQKRWGGAHEMSARVVVPSGLRLSCRRNWESRSLPKMSVWDLPIVRKDKLTILRSDDVDALGAVDGFDDAVAGLARLVHNFVIGCDASRVVAFLDADLDREVIDAAVDVLVAISRYDRGLGATLAGLPDALVMTEHELDPGVSFAADGLVIGVREGARMVAQLDGFPATPARAEVRGGAATGDELAGETAALLVAAGDGDLLVTRKAARFSWVGIERDRERLLAGIRALRSLRPAAGPYR